MAHNALPPLELSDAAKKQISAPKPAPAVVAPQTFDHLFTFPNGDVRIKAKYRGQDTIGSVVSQAMVMASPVWKKFMFPPWAPESNAGVEKTIDFSEDNGVAVVILLQIAHLQFTQVPTEISLDHLYEIALLCEQYDCHGLVRPRLKDWLKHALSEYTFHEPRKEWFYVARTFGCIELFSTVTNDTLFMNSGNDLDKKVTNTLDVVVPEGIIESIVAVREEALKQILAIPHHFVAEFLKECKTKYMCNLFDDPAIDWDACESLTYGSTVQRLNQLGFWQATPDKIHKSLDTVAREVKNLHYDTKVLNDDHEKCRIPRFEKEVDAILDSLDPVLDCHRRHIELRATQLAFNIDSDIEVPDTENRKTWKHRIE